MNMNRPKFCNYWSDGLVTHDSDYKDYIDEIEKYCDNIEKALNKACDELNVLGELVPMSKWPFDDETRKMYMDTLDEEECINIWKEWLFKEDEQD